jgi:BNR repeat-like domain
MRARGAAALAVVFALTGCDGSPPKQDTLPPPSIISGQVALAPGCAGGASSPGRPGEPSLAADPSNPSRLIAAWLDNRSPDTVGIVVAVSQDGGRHWTRSVLPQLLTCAGGPYVHASDPWLSIGPDGVVYLGMLLRRDGDSSSTRSDIAVSVSRDHGTSWSAPLAIESASSPSTQPDKETILADARRPGVAYAVWADYQVTAGVEPSVDRVMFARTTDSGRGWSAPAVIYSGNDEAQTNQLLMTAGGVLVDVFVEGASLPGMAQPPPLPVKLRVMRSTDQGQTWSKPIDAADFTFTSGSDPATGAKLRWSGQNIAATAAGNAIYAAWFENHSDFSTIMLGRSEDAGLHWQPSRVFVREKSQAFLPTLAVAGDATLGILWFDLRHDDGKRSTLDTDVWFSTSKDRGAHWRERHAAGPFDMRAAPATRFGPFIGDYMGLVGLPDGFAVAYVMARPPARNGPTDVFFSRIPS